jgi:hypothetical protein
MIHYYPLIHALAQSDVIKQAEHARHAVSCRKRTSVVEDTFVQDPDIQGLSLKIYYLVDLK